jgi:hypothetical protein
MRYLTNLPSLRHDPQRIEFISARRQDARLRRNLSCREMGQELNYAIYFGWGKEWSGGIPAMEYGLKRGEDYLIGGFYHRLAGGQVEMVVVGINLHQTGKSGLHRSGIGAPPNKGQAQAVDKQVRRQPAHADCHHHTTQQGNRQLNHAGCA